MLNLKWKRAFGASLVCLSLLWNPCTALAEEDHSSPTEEASTDKPAEPKAEKKKTADTKPEAKESEPEARTGKRQEAIDTMKRQLRQINNDGFNAFVGEILASKDLSQDSFNELVDKLPSLDSDAARSGQIKAALKQAFEDVVAASGDGAEADLSLATRDILAERLEDGQAEPELAEKKDQLEEKDEQKKLEETLEELLAKKNEQDGEEEGEESEAEEALQSLLDDANSRFDDILNAANDAANQEEEEEEDPLADLGDLGEDPGASDAGAGSGEGAGAGGGEGSGGGDTGAGEPSSEPPGNETDLGKNDSKGDDTSSANLGNIAKASGNDDSDSSSNSDDSSDFSLDSPDDENSEEAESEPKSIDTASVPGSEEPADISNPADLPPLPAEPLATTSLNPVSNPGGSFGPQLGAAGGDFGGGGGSSVPTINASGGSPLSGGDGDPFTSLGATSNGGPPRANFNYIRTGAKDFGPSSGSLSAYGGQEVSDDGYGRRGPTSRGAVVLNPGQGEPDAWDAQKGPGIFSERPLQKVCSSSAAGGVGVCSRNIRRNPASRTQFDEGMKTQSIFRKTLGG